MTQFRGVVFQVIPWEKRRDFFAKTFDLSEGEWDMVYVGRVEEEKRSRVSTDYTSRGNCSPSRGFSWYMLWPIAMLLLIRDHFRAPRHDLAEFPITYGDLPVWVKRPHPEFKEGEEIVVTFDLVKLPSTL